jgi:DNA-binding ferritin-like protein
MDWTYTEEEKLNPVDKKIAGLIDELLNASISLHKLHLRVMGIGSYATHIALKELYEELPELADIIAEGYQGATQKILTYEENAPKVLYNTTEVLSYLQEIKDKINDAQLSISYSEMISDMDDIKSKINSTMYKLKFLI